MAQVVLGMGSNIGDRLARLSRAVSEMREIGRNLRCSRVYETAPLLPENAPDGWNISYLNIALFLETELPPLELLEYVKLQERQQGREKRDHWGPREIDIDILAYGNVAMETDALTLPHAHLLQRDFALLPLAEVWPDWNFPAKGEYNGISAQKLLEMLGMRENPAMHYFAEPIQLHPRQDS